LSKFVHCYNPTNRHERSSHLVGTEPRWPLALLPYAELAARGKVNLDIFWRRNESLEDSANLPTPDLTAAEIIEDLRTALEQFEEILADLGET
jgi:type I restriction enzyme M protein